MSFARSVCGTKADIGFILDESTSIGSQELFNYGLNFMLQIINSFPIGPSQTRIGVVKFSTTAYLQFGFNQYTTAQSVGNAVSNLIWNGGQSTDIAAAFRTANEQMFSERRTDPDVRTICILITDGQPNVEADKTFDEVQKTKNSSIEVFAIGIGREVNLQI